MLFTMTNIIRNIRFSQIDLGSAPTPSVRRWWLRFEEKRARG